MVNNLANFEEGFEAALQLCYSELQKSNSKKDALGRLEYLIGLVMEHKFDRIKQMLGAIK